MRERCSCQGVSEPMRSVPRSLVNSMRVILPHHLPIRRGSPGPIVSRELLCTRKCSRPGLFCPGALTNGSGVYTRNVVVQRAYGPETAYHLTWNQSENEGRVGSFPVLHHSQSHKNVKYTAFCMALCCNIFFCVHKVAGSIHGMVGVFPCPIPLRPSPGHHLTAVIGSVFGRRGPEGARTVVVTASYHRAGNRGLAFHPLVDRMSPSPRTTDTTPHTACKNGLCPAIWLDTIS